MEFHLWQAYNPKKISVDISLIFKNKIKSFIIGNIKKNSKKIKINSARMYEYFIYQNKPIPLDKLILISKLMKISLIEMEKEIIMYKNMYVPIKNSVKEPKLPIRITPYFTSIVAHLFFDGSVPEDGKGTYYNQKKESIMQMFIKSTEEVFGKVKYSLVTDHRGVLKLRIPRIIGEICKHIYKVKTFNGNTAVLSRFIFSLNKEHKRAFILAAILDEGSIGYDGTISFGVSNKILCENVKELCNHVKLKTSYITCRIKKNNHYYFRIYSKKELLKLTKEFENKYPLISLDYKRDRLESYFETLKYPGLNTQQGGNERKIRIINLIKNVEKDPNELSANLNIPVRTIRRHLSALIKQNKVRRRKKGSTYLYISIEPH